MALNLLSVMNCCNERIANFESSDKSADIRSLIVGCWRQGERSISMYIIDKRDCYFQHQCHTLPSS